MQNFEIVVIGLSFVLAAYCYGALTVILIYLKKMKKNFTVVLIGGLADVAFMTSALWNLLTVPFGPEDVKMWIRLSGFALSAIAFGMIHKTLEKAK